jgi:protein gp37
MAKRLAAMGVRGYDPADPMRPTVHHERLQEPARLNKASCIGVGFMGDLFDPAFSDEIIWQAVVEEITEIRP